MHRLVGALVLLTSLVMGWLWMDFRAYMDLSLEIQRPVYFEIAKGEHITQVIERLQAAELVRRPRWVALAALLDGSGKRIKFGEYEIRSSVSPQELLEMFAAGKVRQHPITLIEGWTFAQWCELLGRAPFLTQALTGKPPAEVMAALDADGYSAEGWFFPDTYFVTKGTTDIEVLRRSFQKMRSIVDREWAQRAPGLPYEKPADALVMASLVEKETARPEERPNIAGVFVRRLRKGMRLQTDPTVIYGMGKDYQGNIRREDLRRDTPYNTYTRSGLPPTPIAMPSLASIRAALHPADDDSLYFVARGDGTHVFSATLAEHERAVDQFQRRKPVVPTAPRP